MLHNKNRATKFYQQFLFSVLIAVTNNSFSQCTAPNDPTSVIASIPSQPYKYTNGSITGVRTDLSWDTVICDGLEFWGSVNGTSPLLADSLSPTSNSLTATLSGGSVGNRTLYMKLRAYQCNPVQLSNWVNASPYPIYTVCIPPIPPQISSIATDSLRIALPLDTPVSNTSGTDYAIFCSTTSQYVQVNGTLGSPTAWQTRSMWDTITVTGLTNNTNYCFYSIAKNNDGDIRYDITNTACATTTSCTQPAITAQPTSISATVGDSVAFSITATGTSLNYQWQKNGTDIIGEINNFYTIPSVALADSGDYTCYVSNACGAVTSNIATLSVSTACTPASITSQPTSATVTEGQPVTFGITATGTSPNYQWKKNGANINGETNPSYTINSTVLSDAGNYTCYVSNGCGFETSSVATLIVNQLPIIVNWIGFYNEIPNNTAFPTPLELWADSTNVTPTTPLKICADGSKATVVKFENKNPNINTKDIRFWIKSDPNGNNSSYTGYFVFTDSSYIGNTVIWKYTHPTYLTINNPYREDTIQAIDISNSNAIIFEYPIQVYRAPVVMVHGLWGNRGSFEEMENKLIFQYGLYPLTNFISLNSPLIFRANYPNDVSFEDNKYAVRDAINGAFDQTTNNDFSSGKVDIIAHSMGGLMSRIYLQGVYGTQYRNDIHKLITLNTPHSGSQAANLIKSTVGQPLRLVLNLSGRNTDNGAVDDLKVNSIAILDSLNQPPNLNDNIVPSHAIVTDIIPSILNTDPDCYSLAVLLNAYAIEEFNISGLALLQYMFSNDDHDMIVADSSQKGGLNTFTNFSDQCHLNSPENTFVLTQVISLLKLDPNNSSFFSTNGFQPPILTPTFKVDPFSGSSTGISGDITITSPTYNSNFYPNDTVPISIVGSNNIIKILYAAGNKDLNLHVRDTAASSTTFYYIVPAEVIGEIKIIALGYDTAGFVDYDTLSVNITTAATLDSIKYYPERIFVPIDHKASISLTGYYNDGITRNLSYINDVQYQIANTSIASYVNSNVIKGKQVGATILTVSYQSKSVQIPIEVYQGEDWTPTGIYENPDENQFNSQSAINQLKLYPNPNTGLFTLEMNIERKQSIELIIFNILGQEIFRKKLKQVSGTIQEQIDLSSYSKGIYNLQLLSDKKVINRKLIIE